MKDRNTPKDHKKTPESSSDPSLIRTVKQEIRILGLDFCNSNRIVGAVLRGGMILDGVLRFPGDGDPDNRRIAEWVVRTRYYPELRAFMVHDPFKRLKPRIIEKAAKLPLIEVLQATTRPRGFQRLQRGNKSLWLKSAIPHLTLKRIIGITWTFGLLPEPVRVAHLLATTSVPKRPISG